MAKRLGRVFSGLAVALLVFAAATASQAQEGGLGIGVGQSRENADELARQAGAAMDAGDLEGAEALGHRAVVAEPESPVGHQVLFDVARAQGDQPAMLAALREVETRVPDDTASLFCAAAASTLLDLEGGPRVRRQARDLAERAITLDGDNLDAYFLRIDAELLMEDTAAAGRTLLHLQAAAPDDMRTLFFRSLVSANEGDWQDARVQLDRAHDMGLDDAAYASLSQQLDDATPWHSGLGAYVVTSAKVLALWLLAFALLLLLGAALSRVALKAARTLPTADGAHAARASQLHAGVQKAYAAVLWLCCGFYYLSLPLVALAVLAAAAALIGGIFMVGYIPIKLVAIIGIVAVVSVFAIVKSLFVRVKDEDPGPELDLAEHPELDRVLSEVADTLETEKVHRVYITPGADLAVFERGGVGAQLRGGAERCLILGAGVLEGMDQRAFKAILAHEYGHFVNRDTAGGGFALAVQRSLYKMAVGLAEGGAAAWYNPAWMFLRAFERVFIRISHGASRLQEVLADRWAALTYGAAAFERGLRHVIAAGVRFDAHANTTLREVIDGDRALSNFYTYRPTDSASSDDIGAAIEAQLDREASAYDSHPAPRERFALVHALEVEEHEGDADHAPVWDLFRDRDAVEQMMTEEIRNNVLQSTGVFISAQDEGGEGAEGAEGAEGDDGDVDDEEED